MSVNITLEFTAEEIDYLSHTSCGNFTKEQSDRFIIMFKSPYTLDDFDETATMHFCSTFLEAKIVYTYFKTKGASIILSDECSEDGNWVVLTVVPFKWAHLNMIHKNNK